jgi:hypothetical protein
MNDLIKGLNTTAIMFKDKLFAMALKVKSQDDKTQMLYMQLDVLTELLTILKSRYRGVHKRAEEEGENPLALSPVGRGQREGQR